PFDCLRARPVRNPHRLPRGARRRCAFHPLLDRVRTWPRLLHRLRLRTARCARDRPARRRRALRWLADAARLRRADSGGRLRRLDRAASGVRRCTMSAPLVLAVPSKGRLQQNAEAFFARAGLELVKPRGARDYRGAIAGVDGVEVAYLSAAEITAQLGQGAVHLGITGEDLVREMIP